MRAMPITFAKLASDFGNGTGQFAIRYFYGVGIFMKQNLSQCKTTFEEMESLYLPRKREILPSCKPGN